MHRPWRPARLGKATRRAPFARPATVRARVSGRIGPIGPRIAAVRAGGRSTRLGGEHWARARSPSRRPFQPSSFAPPGRAAAAQGHFCRTSTARCWSGAQRWTGSDAQLDFRRDFARAAPRRARATIWAGLRPSTSTHGRRNAEPAVARYGPSLEGDRDTKGCRCRLQADPLSVTIHVRIGNPGGAPLRATVPGYRQMGGKIQRTRARRL